MRFKTAGAFRQALEERLRHQSLGSNQTSSRLRKMVAFDRFLARLSRKEPKACLVKGGFAIQLRFQDRTRTTRDIDISVTRNWTEDATANHLRRTASLDLHDWFQFEVADPSAAATAAPGRGLRFPVRCLLDGRPFETFHLDVGFGDPILDPPVRLTAPAVLAFAGIIPAHVWCYSLITQIAEKVHTFTRAYASGPTSRSRDLADILLIASFATFSGSKLQRAIEATFQARATHQIPARLPQPPKRISASYRATARELGLAWQSIEEAGVAAAQFLDPVLQGNWRARWYPEHWRWK